MSTDTFGTEADPTDDVTAADPVTDADSETPDTQPADQGGQADASPDAESHVAGAEMATGDEAGDEDGVDDVDARGESDGSGSSRRGALEAEGDIAADFLEALLDICDIVGDIDVDVDGDRAAVSIVDSEDGRVPRRLVGPDGKVLEALQELTRLAVQSETGQRSRLMLDIAGHRAARRADVVEVARGVIGEVNDTGEQVELEPMSAFERKIVHDEVLAAGLRSESDGVEPHRYVIILPAE